jgi:SAM-dependent methyltransferase
MGNMITLTDPAGWVRRWDLQQGGYIPDREEIFTLMLDVVERLGGAPGRVLDLACGLGSISARARDRWPAASITGVDLDPVLLELGRQSLGDRIDWVEADLRRPGWEKDLGPFDAVLTATALHWLSPGDLAEVLSTVGGLLRPGGVFLDYDTMMLGDDTPRLRSICRDFSAESSTTEFARPGIEDWSSWWAALREEPGLAQHFEERERRFADRDHGTGPTRRHYEEALRKAGFQEVAPLHQVADRILLAAIR